MEDDPKKEDRYDSWYEGGFFWALFGGGVYGLFVIFPANMVGLNDSEKYALVYWGVGLLAVFGAVTRIKPRFFP